MVKLLSLLRDPIPINILMTKFGWKDRTKFRHKYIIPLLSDGFVIMTIPEKPRSSRQKYVITVRGEKILKKITC
jgi:ATP-dependent DNA helicase RecG